MQPILDKNDVFLKQVQKCFLQFCPPLQAYSNFFNLLQNAITSKVSVNCCGPECHPEPGLAHSGSGLAAEHSLPQPSSTGQALLWTHATNQPGCWPAGLSTACMQPQADFSLNTKSLSLLFKTPHTGAKYTTGYYLGLTSRLYLLKWECGQCRRHTNPTKEKAP